jgi:pimeloyl-ACP methyl ester carboxylesterase
MISETYAGLPNRRISATNGVEYAYRETGDGPVPLVLLQHFRGNLDNWDPALVDELAVQRKVLAFDNVGVGGSSGAAGSSVREMALGAIAFIAAMGHEQVDLLGFSIGSFAAQEVVLLRPDVVRRVILASAAPEGAPGMHGWPPQVMGAVGKPQPGPEDYLRVFFTASEASRQTGMEALSRMYARQEDRDQETTWDSRLNQYDAVCAWGIPNHALLQKVSAIRAPVFIASGDSDPMIPPHFSHLLAGLIPHSTIKIYPDSAHGFLFQHHTEFATDVTTFLGS